MTDKRKPLRSPSMEAMLRGIAKQQDLFKRAMEPIFREQKILERALRPYRLSEEMIGSIQATQSISKQLNAFEHGLKPLRQQQEMMKKAFEPWQGVRDQLKAFSTSLETVSKGSSFRLLQEAKKNPALTALSAFQEHHQNLFEQVNAIAKSAQPFAMTAGTAMQSDLWSDTHTIIEESLHDLEDANSQTSAEALDCILTGIYQLVVQSLPEALSKIEKRAIIRLLGFLLPILIGYYWYQQSSQDHKEHDERTRFQFEIINEKLDTLIEDSAHGTFYIVVRSVPLNASRKFSDFSETWLIPGQEVELIERSGKWIKIAAFSPVIRQCLSGWVLKKYLRRVQ